MQVDSSFFSFIDSKGSESLEIDIKRFPRFYKKIKDKINLPKKVQIIGTNGKGTTGRFLAYYLYKSGFHVGHFSSPHIHSINERFWINNHDITDTALELLHKRALQLVSYSDLVSLSYFEYLTFLAFLAFENLDYVIFEAGLGGEYDATSVVDYDLTLVTKIGLDHTTFLGETIEKIAKTKIRAIKSDTIVVSGEDSVNKVAKRYLKNLQFTHKIITPYDKKIINHFLKTQSMPSFLSDNLALCIGAIKYLKLDLDIKLLNDIKLIGRFQKIKKNITIDVGHNELAAQAIKKELKNKKIILVYNTYKDKNYQKILEILKPNILKLSIINIKDDRILPLLRLEKIANDMGIKYDIFNKTDSDRDYLIFGSFLVVKRFLEIEK
jgi:dihydrofolate synthase/folylpolyglutamate synthase